MAFVDQSEIYSTPFYATRLPTVELLREKIKIGETTSLIFINFRKTDGETYFAYIQLPFENLARLNRDLELDRLEHVKEYGKIILEGKGAPSEENKSFMERHYSFDHTDPFADDEIMLDA